VNQPCNARRRDPPLPTERIDVKSRQLKEHLSTKDTNYFLMRLGLLAKRDVKPRDVDPERIPQPLHHSFWTGSWFTIEVETVSDERLARFLEVRRTHVDVRRNYAIIAGIVAAVFVAFTWLDAIS
jgi:hypothetical protein